MITETDLQEAIAECKGQRNPNANTCIKLASFYTILDHMNDNNQEKIYSYAKAPVVVESGKIDYYSDSDFSHIINGKDQNDVWVVMDELMDTLKVMYPRLYDGVMRKVAG